MATPYGVLEVRQTGSRCVVGLRTTNVQNPATMNQILQDLEQIQQDFPCEVLALDIQGVQALPSYLVGHLVALRKHVRIELLNTNESVRPVLEAARLTKVFDLPDADAE